MNSFRLYRIFLIATFLIGLCCNSFATHNKAGEITYRKLNGFTFEITITTYTDPASNQADRCELGIFFGDGDSDTIPRINNPLPCNPSIKCNCKGELVSNGIKKNVYRTTHTYPGPSEYIITVEDPNRVDNVVNIPNSVNIPFYIKSTLIINPLVGSNSSPILNFPPIDSACICKPFYHNPGAIDPDGDSLTYAISPALGLNGRQIPGYSFPSPVCPKNNFEIDPKTGTLTWDGPGLSGSYNVCILITEYRKDNREKWVKVGDVLRDMQIEVIKCNNAPPKFKEIERVCIEAGKSLEKQITATDSSFQSIQLTGIGEPITLINSPATFIDSVDLGSVSSTFRWKTQCSHIRQSEYQMFFKAQDDGTPIGLVNFLSFGISVIGPAPKNVTNITGRNRIKINWDPAGCSNATGYDIYRKIDSTKWSPDTCETGIPVSLGYTKIGSTSGWNSTSFTDDDSSKGLLHGLVYCYRIVALYPYGGEAYASTETCGELPFDVPIIIRNSVATTDLNNGIDSIAWAKPQEISLTQYPAPYKFNIYNSNRLGSASELIYSSSNFNDFYKIDTVLTFNNLNTKSTTQSYIVELFSNDTLTGSTHVASSPFLSIAPDDRRLHLTIEHNVPWKNFNYEIYRKKDANFILIGTTNQPNYIDSNLFNNNEYTYKVKTIGRYSIEGLPDTIYNYSQTTSSIPKDTIPPCAPNKPKIESFCELFTNEISWNNVNISCKNKDAVGYNIYKSTYVGEKYELLANLNSEIDTNIKFENLSSVAGCYAITAVDSFKNESEFSPRVCVDNCPLYELPNAFSPGGNGINDVFHPIYPWRYVKDVEMTIYNRWGGIVFETTNPEILWTGLNQKTNASCPTGVYFYVCTVNEIRLSGIIPKVLKGTITLINQLDYKKPNSLE